MTKNNWLRFWQDMREEGLMLVDAPARKIAIFPNDSGQVVIASSEDGMQCIATICSDEFDAFNALLKSAKESAIAFEAGRHAELAIWCAKKGVNDR